MFGSGISSGFIAKLAGLGSAAKVGVAATTAALTVTLAGGAAGLLIVDNGGSAPAVVQAAAGSTAAPDPDLSAASVVPANDVSVGGETSVATPSGPTPARARASVTTPTTARPAAEAAPAVAPTVPSIPALPVVGGVLPDLSALAGLPADVLSCLAPVLDLVSQLPNVPLDQITGLGSTIVGCVTGIVEDIPLPFGLNACISGILGFVGNLTSQLPFGIPDLSSLDIGACIPSGLPIPSLPGIPFLNGGLFGQ